MKNDPEIFLIALDKDLSVLKLASDEMLINLEILKFIFIKDP